MTKKVTKPVVVGRGIVEGTRPTMIIRPSPPQQQPATPRPVPSSPKKS